MTVYQMQVKCLNVLAQWLLFKKHWFVEWTPMNYEHLLFVKSPNTLSTNLKKWIPEIYAYAILTLQNGTGS